jgi:hypothetical protein
VNCLILVVGLAPARRVVHPDLAALVDREWDRPDWAGSEVPVEEPVAVVSGPMPTMRKLS